MSLMMPLDQDIPETETNLDQKALEAFVVDNDDLLTLESIIGRFNIFDALSIASAEIRHSNFLAFILDPSESHGQGQVFLKAVLMDLLKTSPQDKRPFSPIELDGTDLRGIVVRREWEHIDLFISCLEPPFVIAIENKVYSKERLGQLEGYKKTINDNFPDYPLLFVYLTLDGDDPSDGDWVSYSYSDIYRVLNRVRTTNKNAIGEDVLVFLDHYLNLIGTRFMTETEESKRIDELCQRIYKNHRKALDLMYERFGNPASGVLNDAFQILGDELNYHIFYRNSRHIDFVPKVWLDWLPKEGLDSSNDQQSWFVLRLYLNTDKLELYGLVKEMKDQEKRNQIILMLKELNQNLETKGKGRSKITEKYTRVWSSEKILGWKGDELPETEKIRTALKIKLDAMNNKLNSIESTLKNYFKPNNLQSQKSM